MKKNLGSLLMVSKKCQSPKMYDEIKEILRNCEKTINEASGYNDTTDKILDYITNLQEENKSLKEEMIIFRKITDDYKSRNEKAIEWIRMVQDGNSIKYIEPIINTDELDDLLNILEKGE